MAVILDAVREFERTYYDEMPQEVSDMLDLRNSGIRHIRQPTHDDYARGGMKLLERSVEGLREVEEDYERELFASLYMIARGKKLMGDHDGAGIDAAEAMKVVPEVPEEFAGQIIEDQYVAIASGRISLIMSASFHGETNIDLWDNEPIRESAVAAARLARRTCRYSEDRSRMLFANGEMTDAQRKTARRKHELAAAAATAGLWTPQSTTVWLAEKICA